MASSPPMWDAPDVHFRNEDSQPVDDLELREVELAYYFAALRCLCPTYDYSRVHIDCDWEVLASLYSIFPLESKDQYDPRRHAHGKIPAMFTLHTVSNTLFIRRRPSPDVEHEQHAKASLREFMPAATTSDHNIPASARSVYSVEYELGPFKCVVHFTPDAWSHEDAIPRDTRFAPNLHGKTATGEKSNSESPIQVQQVGEHVSISDLLLVQNVQDAKGIENYPHLPPKRAARLRNKIVHQKHRKAGHRLWCKVFFSRMPKTYRVTLEEWTKRCLKVSPHNNELMPTEVEIEHLRRMFSLLVALREATKSSKTKACVLQLSNGQGTWEHAETKIDLWEPIFEETASRAHDVPKHLCVPQQIVSDEDYRQFWLANSTELHENQSGQSQV
ncbi:uncharacterized protein N0V89_010727 [Didymosphaeria variabile]|uniref:Uncharacterized protein n=1 Tax=Didymosphaeria variabile TaxID=1932322 RepID=A0A9W8XC73_9PLEO|nr:uncharacterized protein N0V89_010727 [Didymosphaeria variabile]KAJ4346795.1 hypothetical protein N0V89_010727 [Didymosphaeria variabile]